MTSYNDPNDFLFAGGSKAAKFPTPGTVVKGIITDTRVAEQTDIGTGAVKRFDNGDPMMQMLITLQTTDKDDAEDDGLRTLYAKGGKGGMLDAIRNAARATKGLQVGGTLAVKYTGDGEAKQRGFNPPKLYQAQYTAPAIEVPSFANEAEALPF